MNLHKVEIVTKGKEAKKLAIDGVECGHGIDEYRISHRALEYPSLELYCDGKLVAKYPLESLDFKSDECEVLNECTPHTP